MGALRDGMEAEREVVVSQPSRSGGPAKRTVLSEPDHTTRVACARLILEYGFGKPVVQQRIEIDDGEGENTDTPQAIAERIREGGVDMRSVLDVYADGLERVESAE